MKISKMTKRVQVIFISAVLIISSANTMADTFTHRTTDEVFHGFATQKTIRNETRVYIEEENSFKALNLAEYDISSDNIGRRNNVVVIPIKHQQVMLSKVISDTLCKTIVEISNKGPKLIILEIDSPGGRADYMKDICKTITKTKNCPIAAFISGGTFGGAFSTAAAVALACDRIYISPDAVIGSMPPLAGQVGNYENISDYINTFSPENLSGFKSYIAALAENKQRPPAVAMAFFDRNITLFEVSENINKKKNTLFIDAANKTFDQKKVREITTQSQRTVIDNNGTSKDVVEKVITLTPTDAKYCKIADEIVDSQNEILQEEGLSDAKVVRTGGIEKSVKKFAKSKERITEALEVVNYLQKRADELNELIKSKEQRTLEDTFERRSITTDRNRWNSRRYVGRRNRRRTDRLQAEVITENTQVIAVELLMDELIVVLAELIRAYDPVITLARRWPGVLPQNITMTSLKSSKRNAQMLQNDTIRKLDTIQYQRQVALQQQQNYRRNQRR